MGAFGFSWIGAVFLVCLLAPNLLWIRCRPRDYDPSGEDRRLLALERIGQVWVTCAALALRDPPPLPWHPWSGWLLGAAALMVLYEVWWGRYFAGEKTMADFTSSLLGIPVAGASLPVAAFFLLGIYRRSPLLLTGVAILGVGHIGIHLYHRREIGKESDI